MSLAIAVGLVLARCASGDGGGRDAIAPDTVADTALADSAAPLEVDVSGDACAPACPVAACAADDGCGGLCPPCPAAVSCADCALRLEIAGAEEAGGVVRRVALALVYDPPPQAPGPTTAEVRLGVTGPGRVVGVAVGDAVTAADKSLAADPSTGAAWGVEADGTIRVVMLSNQTVEAVGAGTLWTYDVLIGGAFEPASAPVVFWIRREGDPIFAPPGADQVVADPAVQAPVAVWPGAAR
ncbi:MAG: hypothetical protein CVU56_14570 [Deltaproteobacteria bacterium HGW-Deltaproteobacteria-14]|nr:MAG: hypothetical protein CVU56_14570 [Deltaproteobacteria bacterium HGW-Deltaproteobacteria-14]